ncbi:hypothetical protein F5X96DRAFT_670823 [Biscogniauxia mediterranea]|nr:hypothetical protein F5X96DRAFT_670823 [Biscogniauxia mediterranea]
MNEDNSNQPLRPRCGAQQPLVLSLHTDLYCRTPQIEATVSLAAGECCVVLDQEDIISVMLISSSPPDCSPGPVVLTASDQIDCGNPNGLLENLTFSGAGDCRVYTASSSIGALWYGCPCSSFSSSSSSSSSAATLTITTTTTTTTTGAPEVYAPPPDSYSSGLMSARQAEAQKETALTAAVVVLSLVLVLIGVLHILSCIYCPYCWIKLCSPGQARRVKVRAERREMNRRGEAAGDEASPGETA